MANASCHGLLTFVNKIFISHHYFAHEFDLSNVINSQVIFQTDGAAVNIHPFYGRLKRFSGVLIPAHDFNGAIATRWDGEDARYSLLVVLEQINGFIISFLQHITHYPASFIIKGIGVLKTVFIPEIMLNKRMPA